MVGTPVFIGAIVKWVGALKLTIWGTGFCGAYVNR